MIVAKAIVDMSGTLELDVDGNNVFFFLYEVKDNYDTETLTFDSHYQYAYYIPVKDISQSLSVNLPGGVEHFEISYGKNQIAFSLGEYSLPDGTVFQPSIVQAIFAQIYP